MRQWLEGPAALAMRWAPALCVALLDPVVPAWLTLALLLLDWLRSTRSGTMQRLA